MSTQYGTTYAITKGSKLMVVTMRTGCVPVVDGAEVKRLWDNHRPVVTVPNGHWNGHAVARKA